MGAPPGDPLAILVRRLQRGAGVRPPEEPGVSAAIEEAFDNEGMTILTERRSCRCGVIPPAVLVHMKTAAGREQELACGEILVAAGHRPVTGD